MNLENHSISKRCILAKKWKKSATNTYGTWWKWIWSELLQEKWILNLLEGSVIDSGPASLLHLLITHLLFGRLVSSPHRSSLLFLFLLNLKRIVFLFFVPVLAGCRFLGLQFIKLQFISNFGRNTFLRKVCHLHYERNKRFILIELITNSV